ncbi:MAG: methionine--tRNA ligase [Planctomycetota bacterium]|jgi:methionyl-tRNA synthetase
MAIDQTITTTIPYVNAKPHVGFGLELVQADVIARYRRLLGEKVRFQTGTDENAFKNVIAARERGVDTEEFVASNAAVFRELAVALNVSFDDFVRTTEPRHRKGVHALWRRLRPDDLYHRSYRGLYCDGCEDFLQEKELAEGVCPDHGTAPSEVSEENVFFRLSRYQEVIEDLIEGGGIRIVPEYRKREILGFIRGGPSQIVYVWIDALVNYLSGPGFGTHEGWTEAWGERTEKTHVIGKNVWKFHAVYWPALLLSAGLSPPNRIVVHGFLTENGKRISKTRGSAIDPIELVAHFGADTVRYALLRGVSPFEDGDFSLERLKGLHDSDLANGLGNLARRLTSLCERLGPIETKPAAESDPPPGFVDSIEAFAFDRSLRCLWEVLASLNRDIDRVRPWECEKGTADVRRILTPWLRSLHAVAFWLRPFLPNSAQKLQAALEAKPVRGCEVLFPRLDR